MHFRDYDEATIDTGTPAGERWLLERMILYGLNGKKIPADLLRKHIHDLNIPEDHRGFLTHLLMLHESTNSTGRIGR